MLETFEVAFGSGASDGYGPVLAGQERHSIVRLLLSRGSLPCRSMGFGASLCREVRTFDECESGNLAECILSFSWINLFWHIHLREQMAVGPPGFKSIEPSVDLLLSLH